MSTEGIMDSDNIERLEDGASWDKLESDYNTDDRLSSHVGGGGSKGDVDWILEQMIAGNMSPALAKQELQSATSLALSSSRIVKNSATSFVNSIITERKYRRNGTLPPFRFQFRNYLDITSPVQFYSPKWNEDRHTGMVVLPVPPETMEVSGGNSPEEVISASGVSYSHAGPYTPLTFSLEGFFPHLRHLSSIPNYLPTDTIRRGFYSPHGLCTKFITAMRAGQPIQFSVVQPSNKQRLMDTHTVVVTDFQWSYRAGHGQDRFWTMTLKEWFPQRMLQTGRKAGRAAPGGRRPGDSRPPLAAARTYIVRDGDNLSKIADKFLNNPNRWREIYELNKVVIERAAKSHGQNSSAGGPLPMHYAGWWIFPGTTLIIPA